MNSPLTVLKMRNVPYGSTSERVYIKSIFITKMWIRHDSFSSMKRTCTRWLVKQLLILSPTASQVLDRQCLYLRIAKHFKNPCLAKIYMNFMQRFQSRYNIFLEAYTNSFRFAKGNEKMIILLWFQGSTKLAAVLK